MNTDTAASNKELKSSGLQMNADAVADIPRSNESNLLFKAETEKIIGFAFQVLNGLGHGFHEKIYENALAVLLKQNQIPFDQQRRFPVLFREVIVGEFAPDLIVFDSVVVDLKVIDRITDHERGQILNYLRITKSRVGLILNFKKARLEFERFVL